MKLDIDEFRRIGHEAVDLAAEYLCRLPDGPVFRPMTPDERQILLTQQQPEHGATPDQVLAFLRDHVFTNPMGNGHPRFFGWVNSPPSPIGIIADFLAAAMDPSCAGGDHAAIYLERATVRWLMELLGFPVEGSMGLLVSGTSVATITCLAAARHWAAQQHGWNIRTSGLQTNHAPLVVYVSEESHSCIRKAAELLGLGEDNVHTVRTDSEFRMDLTDLRTKLRNDRDAGQLPFCVCGSAGTVNTGAIDPLDHLADFCAENNLWLHVDGAYGGVAVADPSVRDRFRGLDRAHSIGVDAHKWLSVPVECGCALVRDGALLRDTFSLVPSYLRTEEGKGFGGLPWYSEYGPQQTRGFRALKLWATLVHAGREGIAAHVAEHNRLARVLAAKIDAAPDLELLAPVELSIVCFRYIPQSGHGDLNALNKAITETVQAEGRAFVSSTTLRGTFALRACILNYLTTEADIDALIEATRQTGSRLASSDILLP